LPRKKKLTRDKTGETQNGVYQAKRTAAIWGGGGKWNRGGKKEKAPKQCGSGGLFIFKLNAHTKKAIEGN